MSSQSFSAKNFSYLVRQGDYRHYFEDTDDRDKILQQLESGLDIESYRFQPLRFFHLNKKTVYALPRIAADKANKIQVIRDDFVLRKINHNLQRIYRVKQANRFRVISCVKEFLANSAPFFVFQADIKSFYENVNRQRILENIENSAIVSYQTKKLLKKFVSGLAVAQGLPRGINISATLAEYCLRPFDEQVSIFPSVYYYARFVDDIILFSTEDLSSEIESKISELLPDGLSLNKEKIKFYNLAKAGEGSISYLGYEFHYQVTQKENKPLKIRIAKQKLAKIKQRLVCAFLAYKKDRNFSLLKKRLLFLTASYPLKTSHQKLSDRDKKGYLHGGIFYSYPLIDDLSCLTELDKFLRAILCSKNAYRKIREVLTEGQCGDLMKFSFEHAYKRRIFRNYNRAQINKITECWR